MKFKRRNTSKIKSENKSKKRKAAKKVRKQFFFDRVYKVVAKIPYGKVTAYGNIAEACGIRSAARTVGWILNGVKNQDCRVIELLTGLVH